MRWIFSPTFLRRIAWSLAAVAALFLAAEAVARLWPGWSPPPLRVPATLRGLVVADAGTGWRLRGGMRGEAAFGATMSTCARGFRADRELEKKPATRLRIVVAGDGNTFGVGVPREAAWAALLEGKLRAMFPWHDIEVVNIACPEDSILRAEARLRALWSELQPDCVIVQCFSGDLASHGIRDSVDLAGGFTGWLRGWSGASRLAARWHACRAADERLDVVDECGLPRVSVEDYLEAHLRLRDLCRINEAEFFIVAPVRHGTFAGVEADRVQEYSSLLGTMAGWRQLAQPSSPELCGSTRAEDARFFTSPLQLSAEGHGFLAEMLARNLRRPVRTRLNEIAEAHPGIQQHTENE